MDLLPYAFQVDVSNPVDLFFFVCRFFSPFFGLAPCLLSRSSSSTFYRTWCVLYVYLYAYRVLQPPPLLLPCVLYCCCCCCCSSSCAAVDKIVSGSLNLIPVCIFSWFQNDLFFVYPSAVSSHLRPRFAYEYILGSFGHARSQGGRQLAVAKRPLYFESTFGLYWIHWIHYCY